MRFITLTFTLVFAVLPTILGAAPNAAAQNNAPRASCLIPALAPVAERREAALSRSTNQALLNLVIELQTGLNGSEVDWAEALRLSRLLMERTQHFQFPALGAHLWRSAAQGAREMLQGGMHGVQVDFDEVERIYQLEEANGVDVSEDRAHTNRLRQGYDDLTRGLEAARRGEDAMARELIQRAAEARVVHAQFIVGTMHLYGSHGMPTNPVEASDWLSRASVAGHADATYLVGQLDFTAPPGITENRRAAVNSFVRAAQRNHAYAMLALGISFERAQGGLPRNIDEARCWYRRALAAGNDEDGSRQEAQAALSRL